MAVEFSAELRRRAAMHAALADPARVVAAELSAMLPAATRDARRVLFLCTHNAGRSQIAMADACPVLPGAKQPRRW